MYEIDFLKMQTVPEYLYLSIKAKSECKGTITITYDKFRSIKYLNNISYRLDVFIAITPLVRIKYIQKKFSPFKRKAYNKNAH